MVEELIVAITIMMGLGLTFASVLATAHRVFHVQEDPRIDQVEEMLPGTNCGACGQPGCRAFAEQLVAGQKNPGSCTVSSLSGIDAIGQFLGMQVEMAEKRVARLLCAGGTAETRKQAASKGVSSCKELSTLAAGDKSCSWGCLGLADCEVACDFEAISMNENGLPVVNVDLCTACGDCVSACPKNLFEVIPMSQKLLVQCRSLLMGDAADAQCAVACNACGRCVADAPEGLLAMQQNLPVINRSVLELASPAVTKRCPTNAIVWLEGQQFTQRPEIYTS